VGTVTNASASPFAPAPRAAALLALVAVLAVLGAALAFVTARLRTELREAILAREARALAAVAAMQLELAAEERRALGLPAEDVFDDLDALLRTSRLAGVLALRQFDAEGVSVAAFPPVLPEARLTEVDLDRLRAGQAVARLQPRASIDELFGFEPENGPAPGVPLVEALVPLGAGRGAAQYWISGDALAAEFAAVDRGLWRLVLAVGLGGGGAVALALGWTFARLGRARRALEERTVDLARANRELALAARTSALGAVTAHLIHGLKNPLAGLGGFVREAADRASEAAGSGEWADALRTTQRLQEMVDEVVALLRDEEAGIELGANWAQLQARVTRRVEATRAARGVTLTWEHGFEGELPGRRAGLVALVLANLIENACEASPPGSTVRIEGRRARDAVELRVADSGSGLPAPVRERLFQPGLSTKRGGGGLGLAISRELARHCGGELALERTGPGGTVFYVSVPAA
jgi:signal transduction histidine kinase